MGTTVLALASPELAGILQRERTGLPLSASDREKLMLARASLARALFGAGESLKTVLSGCGIRQQSLVKASRIAQARVSRILSRPTDDWAAQGARREGREATLRVYRAAAKLLHLSVDEIPEARALLKQP